MFLSSQVLGKKNTLRGQPATFFFCPLNDTPLRLKKHNLDIEQSGGYH
jgi:hypothetical protein